MLDNSNPYVRTALVIYTSYAHKCKAPDFNTFWSQSHIIIISSDTWMEYVKVFYEYTQSVTRTTTPTSVIADRWSVESVQVERGRAERDNSCCPSVTWNVGIPLGRMQTPEKFR